MAQTPTVTADPPAATTRRRSSNPRAPQGPRTVYVILQILDESGEPVAFDKKRVRLVGLETSAETMLSMVESGDQANAFFIRGKLERRGRSAASVAARPASPAINQQAPRAA